MSLADWTGEDIITTVVNALTPISVAFAGLLVARATKRLETSQWVNQKLIERRIALVGEISPGLNDLYCYYRFIGNWKELSPTDIVDRKRTLDRTVFSNRPFLSEPAMAAYRDYMGLLFSTFTTANADARLRTTLTSQFGDRREAFRGGIWNDSWGELFADPSQAAPLAKVDAAYDRVVEALAAEIGT